jgi:copper chaperone CopZ
MRSQSWNVAALVAAVLVAALGGPWLLRQVRSLPSPMALAARAGERVVTLEVAGMTCAMCARNVETEIARVARVSAVEVRLAQERAYVVCAREVPDSALVGAVRRAGPSFMAAVVPK